MNSFDFFIRHYVIVHVVTCYYTYYKCGTLEYNGSSGIVAPMYTNKKPESDDLYCVYKINANQFNSDNINFITLTWSDRFDIPSNMPDCFNNFVLVSTGCGINKEEVGRFCSLNSDKPFPILSRDGCIEIIYRISKQIANTPVQFKAYYDNENLYRYGLDNKCPGPKQELTLSSGLIATPHWPDPYRSRVSYTETCEWRITPQRTHMMIVIIDLDLSQRDFIKLKYYNTKDYNRWTEKKLYAIYSDSEKLYATSSFTVLFKAYSNHQKENRGFLIGYMAYGDEVTTTTVAPTTSYDDEEDEDFSSSSSFISIMVLAICAVMVCLCCLYCRVKKGTGESNGEVTIPINTPSPNEDEDEELNHIDQRNSMTSVNNTNGNLTDTQLTDETPPAYNPHSNYPSALPRSNRSPQNNINEEAPPPSYEDVLQGTYGHSMA
uniref:CUB domain-containing protein n=1 Tax=Clytia hemisphaerica TaxID=252671 RepID=A0A7M5X7T7_9CNID